MKMCCSITLSLLLLFFLFFFIFFSLERPRLGLLGAVYTIDHELVPRKMPYSVVRVHGLHFMVRVLKKLIYKAVGPLTRCKPNVDQEE